MECSIISHASFFGAILSLPLFYWQNFLKQILINMETTIQQWLFFLLGAAALHGCWLALLLFLKNRNNSKAWLLGSAFIFVSLHLINYLLYLTKAIYRFPHAVGVFYPIMFLIGPAFYFFVKNHLKASFLRTTK